MELNRQVELFKQTGKIFVQLISSFPERIDAEIVCGRDRPGAKMQPDQRGAV
jgi:hypothetical protein